MLRMFRPILFSAKMGKRSITTFWLFQGNFVYTLSVQSGSRYVLPSFDSSSNTMILSARAGSIQQHYYQLNQSKVYLHVHNEPIKKIVIIGGGTVGVELAAELVQNFVDKEVQIQMIG
jgi:NADH dehydrogenase FAD-containing subunit